MAAGECCGSILARSRPQIPVGSAVGLAQIAIAVLLPVQYFILLVLATDLIGEVQPALVSREYPKRQITSSVAHDDGSVLGKALRAAGSTPHRGPHKLKWVHPGRETVGREHQRCLRS
jgi:hypothetical protein